MATSRHVLGIDIGGTYLRAGLVDEAYALSHFVVESSVERLAGDEAPLAALARFITGYCRRYLDGGLPRAVSIGFPSTVNKAKTGLLNTPNLEGFNHLEVVAPLRRQLGLPVLINRDVNMLLRSDIDRHRLPTDGVIIGIYVGTGLGNAVMIGGKLLDGKNGVAAELGHIPLAGNDRLCGCGNTGCAETVCSGQYLQELCRTHYPGEVIGNIFVAHGSDAVVRDYVRGLSLPIATEINLLDPDYVILGGGVLQMEGFPWRELVDAIRRHARKPLPEDTLELRLSEAGRESGVIGAGMDAFARLAEASYA